MTQRKERSCRRYVVEIGGKFQATGPNGRGLHEFAKERGIPTRVASERVVRLGWDVHKALTTPVRPARNGRAE